MKHNIFIFYLGLIVLAFSILVLGCDQPTGGSGGSSSGSGNGTGTSGGNGENTDDNDGSDTTQETIYPEITGFHFQPVPSKLRVSHATVGTIIGTLGEVTGGTPPYTFSLPDGDNSDDNNRFTIDGDTIKINDTSLAVSDYLLNLSIVDSQGKTFTQADVVTVYPAAVIKEQESRVINSVSFAMRYVTPSETIFQKWFEPRYQEGTSDPIYPMAIIDYGFWITETEITQELWGAVMGYNPSRYKDNPAFGEVQSKRPVEGISYIEAVVFCNRLSQIALMEPVYRFEGIEDWLRFPNNSITSLNPASMSVSTDANGYRIPNEDEWLWAAYGGKLNPEGVGCAKHFAGGGYRSNNDLNEYTWNSLNSDSITHETGKKLPNELGLFDMSGNVHEYIGLDNLGRGITLGSNISNGYSLLYLSDAYVVDQPPPPDNVTGFRIIANQ
jgi:hypothetical protein